MAIFNRPRLLAATLAIVLGSLLTSSPTLASNVDVSPEEAVRTGDAFSGIGLEGPGAVDSLDPSQPGWNAPLLPSPDAFDIPREGEEDVIEPVAVPEPSALVMIAGLAALLAAMTYLRWHFDRASTAQPQAVTVASRD